MTSSNLLLWVFKLWFVLLHFVAPLTIVVVFLHKIGMFRGVAFGQLLNDVLRDVRTAESDPGAGL